MSYSLAFSPEFFYAPGEPYDCAELSMNAAGKPTSLYSALEHMRQTRPEQWAEMCEALRVSPDSHGAAEQFIDMAQKTDTCGSLSVPVEVYIDPCHDFSVEVWDVDGGVQP
jgi:hypothetical protein